jgi:hypothetical protein
MHRYKLLFLFGILSLPFLTVALLGGPPAAGEKTKRQLALLIAAPQKGEEAMRNDQEAVYQALRQRGFQPEEILTLSGPVSRALLLAFLREAGRRVADWPDGSVFLAYSGHGTVVGKEAKAAKPGLFVSGETVLWEEVFKTLTLPDGVHLTLLPDC